MNFPKLALVEQEFPDRSIANIPGKICEELAAADFVQKVKPGARIAIGVGSRGISNIATIAKTVVEFWKERGVEVFIFPAMGSHGAATAEGQADVLVHFGIHEATMNCPVISSLDVVHLGKSADGIDAYMDRHAYESDGVMLISRIKWHTDFSGNLESGLFKMMAIGLGKFAGAQRYHTYGYKLGLEHVIRTVGSQVLASGKVLGGLAIQEGAHHETAGITAVSALNGAAAMAAREEELLRQVKSWMPKLPISEVDILIVDEAGKNISGSGMDTKVINRSVHGHYNPFPDIPIVHRLYLRSISSLSYRNGVGLGMADVIHDRYLEQIDWNPTYINSLTSGTPAAIRTPIHFPNDRESLTKIAPTVGKVDLSEVTYCWIHNTLELAKIAVSENLIPALSPIARVIREPAELTFDAKGDLVDLLTIETSSEKEHAKV